MELLVLFYNVESLNIYLVKNSCHISINSLVSKRHFPLFLKAAKEIWGLVYRSYSINIYNNDFRD